MIQTFPMQILVTGLAGLCALPALAQERVFRCPGSPVEYINNAEVAKARGCTLMDGGNITIVQGTKPQSVSETKAEPVRKATTAPRTSNDRINSEEQRARDSDARTILEAELKKAEERLAQARKAYANGEPEKQGIESRNYQRYLDRVASLKAEVSRAEADVAGIQREIGRLTGSAKAAESAAK